MISPYRHYTPLLFGTGALPAAVTTKSLFAPSHTLKSLTDAAPPLKEPLDLGISKRYMIQEVPEKEKSTSFGGVSGSGSSEPGPSQGETTAPGEEKEEVVAGSKTEPPVTESPEPETSEPEAPENTGSTDGSNASSGGQNSSVWGWLFNGGSGRGGGSSYSQRY